MDPHAMTPPPGATWSVPAGLPDGTTLLDALREAGIALPAECGGVGTCGLCAVRLAPAPGPSAADRERFDAARLAAGWRLACTAAARAGTVVHLPGDAGRTPVPASAVPMRRGHAGPRPGARPTAGIALAVDLGTTTVGAALVSIPDGTVRAEAAAPNGQRPFGADVLSRIEYGSRGPAELARLRDAAAESIHAAAAEACRSAGADPSGIAGGAIACNPTMAHLLLGANPAPLGRAPFRLVVEGTVMLPAGRIGFPGNPDAIVAFLPAVSSTLGGDALGGAVLLGLDRDVPSVRLLVDVGTNTEMILAGPGRRLPVAASAASGGAFEGASVSCGMRAEPGAVTSVRWRLDDLSFTVAGGGAPRGLSGSGLLDLVALLRRFGVVDPTGRMLGRDALFGVAPPAMLGRILAGEGGEARFLVGRAGGPPVALSAADVRQLQLAKGAIRAALDLMIDEAGIAAGDVSAVTLAGAFGAGIDEESAIALGLFPEPFRGRLEHAGNTSLAAAVEAVRDPRFVERADALARRLRALSLPEHPAFRDRFLAALDFPA